MDGNEVSWMEAVFKWLVGIVGIGITAWNGYIMNAVTKNRDDLITIKDLITRHELEDARTYVSRQDFKDTVVELKDTVKRIYEKIDHMSASLQSKN